MGHWRRRAARQEALARHDEHQGQRSDRGWRAEKSIAFLQSQPAERTFAAPRRSAIKSAPAMIFGSNCGVLMERLRRRFVPERLFFAGSVLCGIRPHALVGSSMRQTSPSGSSAARCGHRGPPLDQAGSRSRAAQAADRAAAASRNQRQCRCRRCCSPSRRGRQCRRARQGSYFVAFVAELVQGEPERHGERGVEQHLRPGDAQPASRPAAKGRAGSPRDRAPRPSQCRSVRRSCDAAMAARRR